MYLNDILICTRNIDSVSPAEKVPILKYVMSSR